MQTEPHLIKNPAKTLSAVIKVVANGLCHEMAKDNPRFEASKFLAACGITLEF